MAALSQHKLTPDDVRAIRLAYSNDGVSMSALGREYGVSTQAVSDVVHRRSFANVRDRDPKPPTPEEIREACERIKANGGGRPAVGRAGWVVKTVRDPGVV